MSVPNLLQAAATEFLTGLIIKANTGGDKVKEAARATSGLAIIAALQQINNGDVSGGVTAVQAAASTTALDPGESLALQSVLAEAAKVLSAQQAIAGGTILGQLEGTIVSNILSAAATTCKAYIPATA